MCGIVGIRNQADESIVAEMVRSVVHRGPDGIAWATIRNNSLGASRLAISGNPDASPVFTDAEKNIDILLNGEIYNAGSLRQECAGMGITFRTDLESEVIAKLYGLRGVDFTKNLKGMFAIAILDGNRLVLARDRFGIKPLYYAEVDQRIIFGSEIKAILAHPDVTTRLNVSSLEEILAFGYIFSPNKTLFEGINQVEPGTAIIFSDAGQYTTRFYETPRAHYLKDEAPPDYASSVEQLRKLLVETVDLLLTHGNHLVGIYLSGGLDSTILTLISRVILDRPVMTFTLADCDESPDLLAARTVAKKLGTKHIERHVTIEDYFNKLRHFIRHYESLMAGGVFDIHGGLAFHLLSETVSDYVKVVFSGEGADELFGGYYWEYTHPLGFADRIRNRLRAFPDGADLHQRLNELFPYPEDENVYRRNIFDMLLQGGLANYHLQSVDRSSSAYGFEVRPPYLFDDLADFALSLPIEYKVPGRLTTKRILRDAFRPELEHLGLDWVLTREKESMPAAVSHLAPMITQRMEQLVEDSVLLEHPLRRYLSTKTDVYLFDIFAENFLTTDNHALHYCIPQ